MLFYTDFTLVNKIISKYIHIMNILEGIVEEVLYLKTFLSYYTWKCQLEFCVNPRLFFTKHLL